MGGSWLRLIGGNGPHDCSCARGSGTQGRPNAGKLQHALAWCQGIRIGCVTVERGGICHRGLTAASRPLRPRHATGLSQIDSERTHLQQFEGQRVRFAVSSQDNWDLVEFLAGRVQSGSPTGQAYAADENFGRFGEVRFGKAGAGRPFRVRLMIDLLRWSTSASPKWLSPAQYRKPAACCW
jgi:hypothetical protein